MHYSTVKAGIAQYLDTELIDKVQGWRKWIIGAGLTIAMDKSDSIYEKLKQHPVVKMLEIIDDNGDIDIEDLYTHIYAEAKKTPVQLKSDILGTITLTAEDVNKLYSCIKSKA